MKNLQNLGKALTNAEQKTVNGGIKRCDYFIYNTTAAICASIQYGTFLPQTNACRVVYPGACNQLPSLP